MPYIVPSVFFPFYCLSRQPLRSILPTFVCHGFMEIDSCVDVTCFCPGRRCLISTKVSFFLSPSPPAEWVRGPTVRQRNWACIFWGEPDQPANRLCFGRQQMFRGESTVSDGDHRPSRCGGLPFTRFDCFRIGWKRRGARNPFAQPIGGGVLAMSNQADPPADCGSASGRPGRSAQQGEPIIHRKP